MAVEMLKAEIYCHKITLPGVEGPYELDFTGSGRHFTDKLDKYGHSHFRVRELEGGDLFVCTIILERVCLCDKQVRPALAPARAFIAHACATCFPFAPRASPRSPSSWRPTTGK